MRNLSKLSLFTSLVAATFLIIPKDSIACDLKQLEQIVGENVSKEVDVGMPSGKTTATKIFKSGNVFNLNRIVSLTDDWGTYFEDDSIYNLTIDQTNEVKANKKIQFSSTCVLIGTETAHQESSRHYGEPGPIETISEAGSLEKIIYQVTIKVSHKAPYKKVFIQRQILNKLVGPILELLPSPSAP